MVVDNEQNNKNKANLPKIYSPNEQLDLSNFKVAIDNSGLDQLRKLFASSSMKAMTNSINAIKKSTNNFQVSSNPIVTESLKVLLGNVRNNQRFIFPLLNSEYVEQMSYLTKSLNIWKENKKIENSLRTLMHGIQLSYKDVFNKQLLDGFNALTKEINNRVKLLPYDFRNSINARLIEFGWAYPLVLLMPYLYREIYRCDNQQEFDRYMISIYMRDNGRRISEALNKIEPLVSGRHKTIIRQMKKMMRQDIRNYVMCYQYLYSLLDYYCSEQVFNQTGDRPNISKGKLKNFVASDYHIERNYQDVFDNSTKLLSQRFINSDWSKVDSLDDVPLTRHSVLHGKYIHDISFLEFIKLFNLTIFVIYMMSDEDKNKSA